MQAIRWSVRRSHIAPLPTSLHTAIEADLQAIGLIDLRSRQWGYRGIIPESALAALEVEERTDHWRAMLQPGGRALALVAAVDGRPVGFAAWQDDGGDLGAELLALYVLEEASGTGVARDLEQAALRQMSSSGHERAFLWVLQENGRARRFYERAGWKADGAMKVITRCGVELVSVRYRQTHGLPG